MNIKKQNPRDRQRELGLETEAPRSTRDWSGIGELSALFLLSAIKGFGPQKFKEIYNAGMSPRAVVENPDLLPSKGKTWARLKSLIAEQRDDLWQISHERATKQLKTAENNNGYILIYSDLAYPRNVFASNNPVPVLYARGSREVLLERKTVACVGSRGIGSPYNDRQREFAETACRHGFSVASGFAMGADRIAHEAAWKSGGRTVCVMPCGLDRPFPPENKDLFKELLSYDKCVFVSEFPFGTGASSLSLRKRNKLIVAFALGVLIAQSSAKGGAMNAYRFAIEQRKPCATFKNDGSENTSGNRLVEEDQVHGGIVFPSTGPDLNAYEKWLRKLSSST